MSTRKQIVGIFVIVGIVLLAACAPKAAPVPAPQAPAPAPVAAQPPVLAPARVAPVKAAWETEWDKTVEAARAEGVISIVSTAGGETRIALTQAMKEKYGLNIEMIAASGSEITEKFLRERRAGIYLMDVFLGGNTTPITDFKPARALDPLEPALILPDVKDPKMWWKEKLPWLDKDHMLLATLGEPEPNIAFNTNLVQPGEVKGYKDLLNPKWKGKMTLGNISVAGAPGKWLSVTIQTGLLNWDYMRQLAKQEPAVVIDRRVQAQGLAQGKYAIGVALSGQALLPFLTLRAPIAQIVPAEGTYLASDSSCVALVNRAPHPNAAKVFINWFLSKEGQTLFSRVQVSHSRRLDVPTDHIDPKSLRQSGVEYFDADNEEVILKEPEIRKQGKEIFGIQ